MSLAKLASMIGAITEANRHLVPIAKGFGIVPKQGTHWERLLV